MDNSAEGAAGVLEHTTTSSNARDSLLMFPKKVWFLLFGLLSIGLVVSSTTRTRSSSTAESLSHYPEVEAAEEMSSFLRKTPATNTPRQLSWVSLSNREPSTKCREDVAAEDMIAWLRDAQFNKETQQALLHHPIVVAAEAGKLPLEALRLMLHEEYFTETSDLRSMAAALGRFGDGAASKDFFVSLTGPEATALTNLQTMASVVGLTPVSLETYQPMAPAHAYSAYIAQLANYEGRAGLAAAFAVNFPTWGRMCGRIRDALLKPPYNFSQREVQYLTDFATPLGDTFEEAATKVIAEGMARGQCPESIRDQTRLTQAYEVMFWDAIWNAAKGYPIPDAEDGAHQLRVLH